MWSIWNAPSDLDYRSQSGFEDEEPEQEDEEIELELEPPDDMPEPPDDGPEPPEQEQGEQQ